MAEHIQRYVGTVVVIVLGCLGLTACGESVGISKSTGVSTGTAKVARDGAPVRLGQLDVCLQRNGIAPTGRSHALSVGVVDGLRLPRGVTRARYEAALRRCRSTVDLGRAFQKPEANRALSGIGAPRSPG
jgi:hypothetical protein